MSCRVYAIPARRKRRDSLAVSRWLLPSNTSAPNAAWGTEQDPNPVVVDDDGANLNDMTFTLETTDRTIDGDNLGIVFPDSDVDDTNIGVEKSNDELKAGSAVIVDFEDTVSVGGGEDIEDGDRVQLIWKSVGQGRRLLLTR